MARAAGTAKTVGTAMGVDAARKDRIRRMMRQFPNGVALVTNWLDGRPWGLTINTFNSVSFDPPRVIVCLSRHTASLEAIEGVGYFGISLLSDFQVDVAQFGAAAGQPKFLEGYTDDRLQGDAGGDDPDVNPVSVETSPMVRDAHHHVDCKVAEIFQGGDHALILGDVRDIRSAGREDAITPLLYYDGQYRHLGAPLNAKA
jgi:3-hydroxy-9,10-secoandrosta-1,3,5(10)-triene-9,17-dione monooxygenase reductase component